MASIVRLGALALLAFGALVACGGGATTATPAAAAKAASVSLKGFAFVPATLTVSPGTVVTFKNEDGATHNVVSGTSAAAKTGLLEKSLAKDDTATVTLDKAGSFDFICTIHSSMKMKIEVK